MLLLLSRWISPSSLDETPTLAIAPVVPQAKPDLRSQISPEASQQLPSLVCLLRKHVRKQMRRAAGTCRGARGTCGSR